VTDRVVMPSPDFPCFVCRQPMMIVGYNTPQQRFGVHCPACGTLHLVQDLKVFAAECQAHASQVVFRPRGFGIDWAKEALEDSQPEPEPEARKPTWRELPPLI